MIIQEAKIMACNRGKYKDLSIRFTIKAGDYSLEEYETLHDMAERGDLVAIVMDPFEKAKEPEKDRTLADFRMEVIRDFGDEAYRRVKARLGVEHLKDLPEEGRTEKLREELYQLRLEAGFYDK